MGPPGVSVHLATGSVSMGSTHYLISFYQSWKLGVLVPISWLRKGKKNSAAFVRKKEAVCFLTPGVPENPSDPWEAIGD